MPPTARKDFEHYSLYWGTLPVGDQWLLVSHSLLNWVFLSSFTAS